MHNRILIRDVTCPFLAGYSFIKEERCLLGLAFFHFLVFCRLRIRVKDATEGVGYLFSLSTVNEIASPVFLTPSVRESID